MSTATSCASCASIVGDDFYVADELEEPTLHVPADCQPIACPCAADEQAQFCPTQTPIGCGEPWQTDECPADFWCCPVS